MEELLELANEMMFNSKAEAQAVYDYDNALKKVYTSEIIDEKTKEVIVDNLSEIIADELNHSQKLLFLYTLLTSIEPNKD